MSHIIIFDSINFSLGKQKFLTTWNEKKKYIKNYKDSCLMQINRAIM